MVFLDKDKVNIQVQLRSPSFIPGAEVQATVQLDVMKPIEATAVRVVFKGKEKAWKRVQQGKRSYTVSDCHIHLWKLITVAGASKQSNRTKGLLLQPGHYTYNVQFQMPVTAAPSCACSVNNGGCRIYYRVKAYVDIPNGFDAKHKIEFTVLSAAPVGQLMEARTQPLSLPEVVGQINGCEYCGCFCCPHDGAFIKTDVIALPRMAIVAPNTEQLVNSLPAHPAQITLTPAAGSSPFNGTAVLTVPRNANSLMLHLTIHNGSVKDTISMVRVKLMQFVQVKVRGRVGTITFLMSQADFAPASGTLNPAETITQVVTLNLPTEMSFNVEQARSRNGYLPLPTLRTAFAECSTIVDVSFPGVAVEGTVTRSDVFSLVAAVDFTNRVPMVPSVCTTSSIFPEEWC